MKTKLDVLLIHIFFIAVISFSSCTTKSETQESGTKINVEVAPVVKKTLALPITTSGKLYTSTESKLSFKIPGIIARIYTDEGQSVNKGAQLAALDLVEMKAKVRQAQSGQQKAERDLERAKRLYADSVVTLEQLQNSKTALEIASSDAKVAEFNLQYSTIYAPERGRILKRFAEEGELIGAGNPVFLYGANNEGWVLRAGVTDQQIIQLQIGDNATITFDVYPDEIFAAKVSEIEAVANPYTGTFEVELQLEPSPLHLYSGFVGKVTIIPAIVQEYSIIPIESLIEGDVNEGYVYGIDRSKSSATKFKINIGKIVENQMLVYSGLENVTEVVTFGAPYLTDNSIINIAQEKNQKNVKLQNPSTK